MNSQFRIKDKKTKPIKEEITYIARANHYVMGAKEENDDRKIITSSQCYNQKPNSNITMNDEVKLF